MIARVTLELALGKEFDYLVPDEMAGLVEVGTRVKVPFARRQVMGCVTALPDSSPHPNLRPLIKIIGRQSFVSPKILQLARWMGEYYCCPPEIALKTVLPEAVRKEKEGWREQLFVRALPVNGAGPKLSKRQAQVLEIVRKREELPFQELLQSADTTAQTLRRLEDKGLITITPQIVERDPYDREIISATQSLTFNADQQHAFEEITAAMGGTGVPPVDFGVPPKSDAPPTLAAGIGRDAQSKQAGGLFHPISEITVRRRLLPHFEIPGSSYHVTWRTFPNLTLSEEAREKTLAACRFWHGKKMKCYLACVMPDHVHLLIQSLPIQEKGKNDVYSLSEILHGIKSFSAHEVNKVMKRHGPVWQQESFDRMIRSETDLHEKWDYIWNNPRQLELVGPLEEYPFIWTPGGTGVPPVDFGVPPKSAPKASADVVLKSNTPSTLAAGIGRDAQSRQAGGLFHRVFLLHGVTGSGKTEVYLQAIARSLQQGKGAIVLVPEISLTPQTVERFKARFSSGPLQTLVAVLHSHLSGGERHDEWHKIRQGRARIVIGARSAVFAPVDPLGLIIVDEEHEHSYKQEESPRYHARDVAVVRARMENAVVVLGSATPSMESFYNAQKGKYRLLEMPIRADHKKMPVVRVVDMRQVARHEKGTPILSPQLKEAIHSRLDRREQTLLFLNRRGFATSLQCPLCGYVAKCPNCSLSLTYHRQAGKLRCHICAHEANAPVVCPEPKCRNPAIRYAGLGTEKVEATLGKLFPTARIRRMDSDTLKRKEDYRRILGDFRTGKIDVLVGTQMIAKGLHFPNVTLVGIIHADLSLHMPDFRAGERTFQLLTQVAGRAGRGDVEGEVFVQAFTPFHPAIQYARRHDFTGFYEDEIYFRRKENYPPVSRIALLLLKGRNEEKVKFSAMHVRHEIEKWSGTFPGMILKGPAPALLARAEGKFRFHIMLRTRQMTLLSQKLAGLIASLTLPEEVAMTVDIDPVNLM
jgi:primosomal protein N'